MLKRLELLARTTAWYFSVDRFSKIGVQVCWVVTKRGLPVLIIFHALPFHCGLRQFHVYVNIRSFVNTSIQPETSLCQALVKLLSQDPVRLGR